MIYLISFLIAAFGIPSLSSILSIFAGAFGYGLFWFASRQLSGKRRFWVATIWFTAVQAVQLSWLTSTEYMGPLILAVYALVSLGLGLQFGLLTSQVFKRRALAIAGLWVLLEWSRLFVLTGFPWNPIGLALAASPFSIQWAALFGVYGLGFWVIFTNLLAFRAFCTRRPTAWILCAVLPYAYGVLHRTINDPPATELSIALVQTALKPEERDGSVHPLEQWHRILSHLQGTGQDAFDLIVLPEAALPHGAKRRVYPIAAMEAIWGRYFGYNGNVSNVFLLQALSDQFGAEVIAGLDDADGSDVYNAAFHFLPNRPERLERYEKRILVPVGEYVPFVTWGWLARFASEQFGIDRSFSAGDQGKIFQGALPIGVFICLEETYSQFVNDIRRSGAKLFVNVTNDAWFPGTRLPWHHFDHGRLRAVENGICLVRACNTGVTAAIDPFGDIVASFPVSDRAAGALHVKLPVRSFTTLYSLYGDSPILIFSVAICLLFKRRKGCSNIPLSSTF